MELTGRVIALTGAASGIGRALAVGLAAEGAELALCDIDESGLAATAALAAGSPHVTTHVVDVSDRAAVEAFAHRVGERHGRADVLINNAAVSCIATVEQATYEDFAWVLGVDLWGVLHGVKAFLPLLRARPRALIVNIGSVNSFLPFPTSGPYSIAKHGVDALSATLMAELAGSPVSVTSVYPGGVRTNASRNARYTTGEDVATFERSARTTPERAARSIIRGIRRDRPRVVIGLDARVLLAAHRLVPVASVRVLGRVARRMQRSAGGGIGSVGRR